MARSGAREIVRHGIGTSRRLVLSRQGDRSVMRECAIGIPVLRRSIELHPQQLPFREDAGAFTAWWRFERTATGTRVRRDVETPGFAPRALAAWAARKDLEHHARECEADLPIE